MRLMAIRIDRLPPLPARPREGHKGLFGRVLIVGGNPEMIGAPVLAGVSAFRSGAGLVQIAIPKSVLSQALTIEPELIGLALPTSPEKWKYATEQADAIVVGPGMGQSSSARTLLRAVLKLPEKPVVVDADALNLLAAGGKWPSSTCSACVLTPHPGEMKRLARLFGKTELSQTPEDRLETAIGAATSFGQVVVLKGHRTIVTDAERYYVNNTGDSTLSKAGTGDILTGICATLLAQGLDRFDAACISVWVHGKAGEIAGQRFGQRSALAREILCCIGEAFDQYARLYGYKPFSQSDS